MITALTSHTNHGGTEHTEHYTISPYLRISVSPWPVSEIELDAHLREAAKDDGLRSQP
jgi:hypothetical protein